MVNALSDAKGCSYSMGVMGELVATSNENSVADAQLQRESWRIIRIMTEFVEGFEALCLMRPSVGVFGSARTAPG